MSVLIKGMEMPESCLHCEFLVYHKSQWCCHISKDCIYNDCLGILKNERAENCPCFAIPAHGDLIDRDALIKKYKDMALEEWNAKVAPYSWTSAFEEFIDDVEEMPAIIPAEKEDAE